MYCSTCDNDVAACACPNNEERLRWLLSGESPVVLGADYAIRIQKQLTHLEGERQLKEVGDKPCVEEECEFHAIKAQLEAGKLYERDWSGTLEEFRAWLRQKIITDKSVPIGIVSREVCAGVIHCRVILGKFIQRP